MPEKKIEAGLGYWDLLPPLIQDHVLSFLTHDEKLEVADSFPWLNEVVMVTTFLRDYNRVHVAKKKINTGFGYWDLLPPLIQDHVMTFLTDDEKLDVADSFPWVTGMVKSMTFNLVNPFKMVSSKELELFERCPNITHIVFERTGSNLIEDSWNKIAAINPNLKSVTERYKRPLSGIDHSFDTSDEADVHLIRRFYLRAAASLNPGFDGSKFVDTFDPDFYGPGNVDDNFPEHLQLNQTLKCSITSRSRSFENWMTLNKDERNKFTEIVFEPSFDERRVLELLQLYQRVHKVFVRNAKGTFSYEPIINNPRIKFLSMSTNEGSDSNIIKNLLNCRNDNLKDIVLFNSFNLVIHIMDNLMVINLTYRINLRRFLETFRNVSIVVLEIYIEQLDVCPKGWERWTEVEILEQIDTFNAAHLGLRKVSFAGVLGTRKQ